MVDENNRPYVLPFNFGYKDKCIYLHSGSAGKKINILKKNNSVCVVFSIGHDLSYQNQNVACSYIMSYKSVICYGKVEFIEEYEKKVEAMNIIMKQYTGKVFDYSKPAIDNVLVYKVVVEEITAKEFGNLS
jgi:nitroimidazol reductase NimA-like FMN-containing flavoprotein (pyridoxamine 5'-phosphate oxidase superfamily)